MRRCLRTLIGSLAAIPALVSAVSAQARDAVGLRPMATRAELEAFARGSGGTGRSAGGDEARDPALVREAERRLREGDFRPGDLILIEVQGEATLSDTFAVSSGVALALPAPTVGAIELGGVLRAELEPRIAMHLRRFMHEPIVRARPLVRLAISGQVTRAGFYAVPVDAPLADALMAAHGLTTQGDLKKLRVERGGRPYLEGRRMRDALARGWTIDDARLRDGDELTVGRDGTTIEEKLRFALIVVSLTGGVYGFTRR